MAHMLQTPPVTPISNRKATPLSQLLADHVQDDQDDGLIHVRLHSSLMEDSGSPDSLQRWLKQESGQFIFRPSESPNAKECLDIRRDGDPAPPVDVEDPFLDPPHELDPSLASFDTEVDWSLSAPSFNHLLALPGSSVDPLFDTPTIQYMLSPPTSPTKSYGTLYPKLSLPTGRAPVFPGGADPFTFDFSQSSQPAPSHPTTIAPKDVYNTPTHSTPALPNTPADTPQRATRSLPSESKWHRDTAGGSDAAGPSRTKDKKQFGRDDDSDFEMDDTSSDGEDGSEFGASTSKGRKLKASQRASGSSSAVSSKNPLYCEYDGCNFVQRNGRAVDLMRHMETHKNPDNRSKFVCPDCGHPVSRRDALRRHQDQSCKANSETLRRPRKKRVRKSGPY